MFTNHAKFTLVVLSVLVLAVGLAFLGCSVERAQETESSDAPAANASLPSAEAVTPDAAPAPSATPNPTAAVSPPSPTATPPPRSTPITKQAAAPATPDPDALATLVAARPDIMLLESAREEVPFDILTPGYLPEGYQADEYKGEQYVMLLEGFQQRKRGEAPVRLIRGVSLTYYDRTTSPGSVSPVIQLEQTLSRKGETIVDPAEKEPSEDIGGFEADVWRAWNLSGDEIIVLIWEDAPRGVRFDMSGFVSKEEMLRVARSLR